MVRARNASSCVDAPRWRSPTDENCVVHAQRGCRAADAAKSCCACGRRTPRQSWAARKRALAGTVVVQQTHLVSDAAIARFTLAQQQLRAASAQHFVAFLIGDDPKRDRCSDARHPRAADLARLRRALGDVGVWCIDPPAFSKLWPGFFDGVAKLPWTHPLPPPRQAPHWRYRASNALGWHWAWAAACDLPGLVGVLIRNSRGGELAAWWKARGFRWLWTLDWDVGWTGDLAGILAAFGDQKHDYLAGAPPHLADPTWFPFFPLRNHLADHQVYQTLVVPQRFSRRMLDAVDASVRAGNLSFCEARSPSLCALHGWCTQDGLTELQPSLFGPFSCCNSISTAKLWEAQKVWHDSGSGRPPGQLMHRVRDAATYSVNTDVHAHATWRGATRKRTTRRPKI